MAFAAGDITQQLPIELRIELGTKSGEHIFVPNYLKLETGKLYKLVLYNPDKEAHYFTSLGLANRVFTRKVQVMSGAGADRKALSEIKARSARLRSIPRGQLNGGSCLSRVAGWLICSAALRTKMDRRMQSTAWSE